MRWDDNTCKLLFLFPVFHYHILKIGGIQVYVKVCSVLEAKSLRVQKGRASYPEAAMRKEISHCKPCQKLQQGFQFRLANYLTSDLCTVTVLKSNRHSLLFFPPYISMGVMEGSFN